MTEEEKRIDGQTDVQADGQTFAETMDAAVQKVKDLGGSVKKATQALYNLVKNEVSRILLKKILDTETTGRKWGNPFVSVTKTGQAPMNALTRAPYTRGNALILLLITYRLSATIVDPLPVFVTYKQCEKLGWRVKKGAKGIMLFFSDILLPQGKKGEKQENEEEGEKETNVFSFFRRIIKSFYVFHISDTEPFTEEGKKKLDELMKEGREKYYPVIDHDKVDGEANADADGFIQKLTAKLGIKIRKMIGGAFFTPLTKEIFIPIPEHFVNYASYYSTLFHELGHYLVDRMEGEGVKLFKALEPKNGWTTKERYAIEEMLVEIFSAKLCMLFLLTPIEKDIPDSPENLSNHAEYIKNWGNVLRDKAVENKNFLWELLLLADKLSDYAFSAIEDKGDNKSEDEEESI